MYLSGLLLLCGALDGLVPVDGDVDAFRDAAARGGPLGGLQAGHDGSDVLDHTITLDGGSQEVEHVRLQGVGVEPDVILVNRQHPRDAFHFVRSWYPPASFPTVHR